MEKGSFPWVIIAIGVVAYAAWGILGLILAALGMAALYGRSIRTHPRIRHTGWGSCKGTGEVRSRLFRWTFHKCPKCQSGRLIRYGAGHWGTQPIQAEYKRGRRARKRAKDEKRWRLSCGGLGAAHMTG